MYLFLLSNCFEAKAVYTRGHLQLREQLIEMSHTGYFLARAVHVATQLSIADELVGGPKSAREIAQKLDLNEQALHRLFRMLASHGIFVENENQEFSLTPLAELLRSDSEGSMHNYICAIGDCDWNSVRDLMFTIKTGMSPFYQNYGMSRTNYLEENPETIQRDADAVECYCLHENSEIIYQCDFLESMRTIVDLGGGKGELIREIVKKYPKVNGILFDLLQMTKSVIPFDGLTVRSGNYFEWVPAGADAYLIKKIISSCDDEHALKLLKNCYNAIRDHARIFIIDYMICDGNTPDFNKDLDILRMTMLNNSERCEQDYKNLCTQVGLEIVRTIPIASYRLSVIEVKKKVLN